MENIKEQFARLYMELDLTDDQAAMIRKLQRDVDAALRQPPVVGQSEQFFCEEHTPKVRYDWQKGNCLTCAKKLEAK
jgi:hypothetical protein